MHNHLQIEWPPRPPFHEQEPDTEDICLYRLEWTLHREQPLLRIENPKVGWVRYIPFTSMVEFAVEHATSSCDAEEEDEPEFIGNSRLMERGSGIYLDADGKVDEGASS